MTAAPAPEPSTEKGARRLQSPKPLARLWPLLRPYAWRLALASLCLLVAAGVGLAFPQVVKHLLDAAFERHDGALLDRIAILLLALFALQGVMNFVQVYLLSSTTERVLARLREDLFAHLVRLSFGFYAGLKRDIVVTCMLAAHAVAAIAIVALSSGNIGTLIRHRSLAMPYVIWLSATGAHECVRRIAASRAAAGQRRADGDR